MKKDEVKVGGEYMVKVSDKLKNGDITDRKARGDVLAIMVKDQEVAEANRALDESELSEDTYESRTTSAYEFITKGSGAQGRSLMANTMGQVLFLDNRLSELIKGI